MYEEITSSLSGSQFLKLNGCLKYFPGDIIYLHILLDGELSLSLSLPSIPRMDKYLLYMYVYVYAMISRFGCSVKYEQHRDAIKAKMPWFQNNIHQIYCRHCLNPSWLSDFNLPLDNRSQFNPNSSTKRMRWNKKTKQNKKTKYIFQPNK